MARSLGTLIRNAQHSKPKDFKRYMTMLELLPEEMFGRQRRTRMSPEQIMKFFDQKVKGPNDGGNH